MKNKTFSLLTTVKNYSLIVFGTLLAAFATAIFIVPFDLIVGGVSGIAIVLSKLPLGISANSFISIVMWSLFILGAIILGKRFALKTLISVFLFPLGVTLFSKLIESNALNGFFNISEGKGSSFAPLIASLFSGILIGTGCAFTFLGGGSTGGIDILALCICKYFNRIKTSTVIFYIDAITIFAGMFIVKDLISTLLGIMSAFIWSSVVDKVLLGSSRAFSAQIITKNSKEFNRLVIEKLKRTATVIKAKGGFSGEDTDILLISFAANEYSKLLEIAKSTDSKAFITIHNAHEIRGHGWKKA